MSRYCTECGVPSGEKHVRSKLYVWKKKKRNLIEEEKEKNKFIITKGGNSQLLGTRDEANYGGGA